MRNKGTDSEQLSIEYFDQAAELDLTLKMGSQLFTRT